MACTPALAYYSDYFLVKCNLCRKWTKGTPFSFLFQGTEWKFHVIFNSKLIFFEIFVRSLLSAHGVHKISNMVTTKGMSTQSSESPQSSQSSESPQFSESSQSSQSSQSSESPQSSLSSLSSQIFISALFTLLRLSEWHRTAAAAAAGHDSHCIGEDRDLRRRGHACAGRHNYPNCTPMSPVPLLHPAI
jgi:hypothetical protein